MKTKLTIALVALVMVVMATPALATMTLSGTTASTTIGGGLFQASTGVTLTATATTTQYTAISGHTAGDKEFATNDSDPKIGSKSKTTGAAPATASSATQDISSYL